MIENRTHPRFPFQWPVALVFNQGLQNGASYHGKTCNLSLGGCALYIDYNIQANRPVTLLLSLPADSPDHRRALLEIRGHLSYTILATKQDQFRCGIEFINFKGNGLFLLEQAIKERIPDKKTFA